VDVQIGGKIARIAHVDLQEDNRLIRRDVIILALLLLAVSILSVIAPAGLFSDNAQFAPSVHFVYETLCLTIEGDLLDANPKNKTPNGGWFVLPPASYRQAKVEPQGHLSAYLLT
jgi:hypothetical protein